MSTNKRKPTMQGRLRAYKQQARILKATVKRLTIELQTAKETANFYKEQFKWANDEIGIMNNHINRLIDLLDV